MQYFIIISTLSVAVPVHRQTTKISKMENPETAGEGRPTYVLKDKYFVYLRK